MVTGGGGGWGDPMERPADQVLADVLDGYVTARGAAKGYGVELDAETLEIDAARTAERRHVSRRDERRRDDP
jgi:N-methylhydantoinase B/oxoprolinase/acetone carboxylase alpha subunit